MSFSSKLKKEQPGFATNATKSFFGNSQQPTFFSAPAGLQRKPTGALPEFSVNNFVKSFANFDAQYSVVGPVPATGTLFIAHGVHMNYPKSMTKSEQTTFENDFVKSVHEKWSDQHLLGLLEPGFSSYMCNVDVTAHVEDNPKDAHTVIDVVKPKPKEKRFRPRVSDTDKKPDSQTTHKAKLDFRDPTIEKKNKTNDPDFIRDVGNFDFDSDKINSNCQEDIDAIITFINSIPDKPGEDCKFSLIYTGRASSDGDAAYNKKLSERRTQSVSKILDALPGFCLSVSTPAGEEEATESAEFRRVSVGVFDHTKNKTTDTTQNLAAHEFGHMVGLGDEYVETKPEIPGTKARFFGDKPRNHDLVKDLIDEDAANELIVRDSANIMSLGNEIKRGHYVMFVAAIDVMTRPEIEQATGKKNAKWLVF
jgi:outer membrane protein OmpA-like peptidoglycan-associated protein